MKEADYLAVVEGVQRAVARYVAPASDVAVVSRGDERLLELAVRRARHFPGLDSGRYAGSYPANSAEAIEQLESLRADGVDHLVFPSSSLWWLDHYDRFAGHLARYGTLHSDEWCVIVRLRGEAPGATAGFADPEAARLRHLEQQVGDLCRAVTRPRSTLVVALDRDPDGHVEVDSRHAIGLVVGAAGQRVLDRVRRGDVDYVVVPGPPIVRTDVADSLSHHLVSAGAGLLVDQPSTCRIYRVGEALSTGAADR